jgi:hypothetical protein
VNEENPARESSGGVFHMRGMILAFSVDLARKLGKMRGLWVELSTGVNKPIIPRPEAKGVAWRIAIFSILSQMV